MKKKPVMCIVAGPNGSGKTTTTEQLLKNEWGADSLYINPDNIAKEIYGDWNSTEAVLKAAQKATEQRYECLKNGTDFVFETVFSSAEKMDFIQKAKDAGFFIRIFYVCTESPLININRIAQRYLNGGHEVPISKTISRYYSSLENISRAIKIADRVYLYDNSVENAAPRLIIRTSDGMIAKQYVDDLPDWVRAVI
ncbi:MAG: zeta toxin family protein [Bacteroidaceae bacterium]|nr:zeta toxin family protein [Bacteroidaceae bacterium]